MVSPCFDLRTFPLQVGTQTTKLTTLVDWLVDSAALYIWIAFSSRTVEVTSLSHGGSFAGRNWLVKNVDLF